MTLDELMRYLDDNTDYGILAGSPEETLHKARGGSHPDPLLAEVIRAFADECGCEHADCAVERAQIIKAMGPIRLKYMADDAPVEAFRLAQRVVVAIDGAFNEEALRVKGK